MKPFFLCKSNEFWTIRRRQKIWMRAGKHKLFRNSMIYTRGEDDNPEPIKESLNG